MNRTELRALIAEMQRRHPDLEFHVQPRVTTLPDVTGSLYQVDVTVAVTQRLYINPRDTTPVETIGAMVEDEVNALREATGERVRAMVRHTRLLRERGHNPIAQRLLETPLAFTDPAVYQPPPLTRFQPLPAPPSDAELVEALLGVFTRHDTVNRFDVQRRLFPRVDMLEYDTAFNRAMVRARDELQRDFRPSPHIEDGLYELQNPPPRRLPSRTEVMAHIQSPPRPVMMMPRIPPTEMAILPDPTPRDRPHLMLRPPVSVPIEPGGPRRPVTMPEPAPASTEPAPEAQSLWERLEES